MKRKLTTIFCADGVGYSRLMEQDEAAAFAELRRARALMAELFARHDARQVNSWGDAIIAEFPSVVEAVRCAVEVQEALAAQPGAGLAFRIGVNLGDVLIDGEDLYGDGVNVAARLQEMAEPGGVMISATVHELVRKQLSNEFRHVGLSDVKSMEEKVDAWAVEMAVAPPPPPPRAHAAPHAHAHAPRPEPLAFLPRMLRRGEDAWDWVMRQPRKVRRAAGLIFFFFMLNLLFTGIAAPWFIFPSAPFAVFIWLHWRREQARDQGAGERLHALGHRAEEEASRLLGPASDAAMSRADRVLDGVWSRVDKALTREAARLETRKTEDPGAERPREDR